MSIGSIQVWLQKFDNVIEECKTVGATVTDEMKRIYLMKNINEEIIQADIDFVVQGADKESFPRPYIKL